jgi:chloramphenicol-sensitive protein RarD
MTRGLWYGVGAYVAWGFFPIYWKLIAHVPATQLIAHRIVWSFVTLTAILWISARRGGKTVSGVSGRALAIVTAAALLIAVNWYLFIWAVNNGLVVETSLGYFITPLVNVLLGVFVFRERLRPAQRLAVAIAAIGVFWLTHAYGAVPMVSLGLALSFGSYGVLKKKVALDSMPGLWLETGILFVPALLFLVMGHASGRHPIVEADPTSNLLIVGGGLVTTIPLLLFASAVKQVPLSVIGLLQYIAPTMQFLLGVLLYREPFHRSQLIGFGFVWAALVLFAVEGVKARRATSTLPVLDEGAL